jgi:SpoIID/LytB domain protein
MKIKVKITTQSNMNYFNCESGSIVEVDLEDYVACVVASEMGNAALEACKAQAVASRTFAVSRGVLEGKAISDDAAKAQAYIASRNNYENCNKAAKETCGQIL